MNDLAQAVEPDQLASEYPEASAAVHSSTQLDGLVAGDRAFAMAAHNTCFALSRSVGELVLSEPEKIDDALNRAVETLIAMSHQVALQFRGEEEPPGDY